MKATDFGRSNAQKELVAFRSELFDIASEMKARGLNPYERPLNQRPPQERLLLNERNLLLEEINRLELTIREGKAA